MSELQAVHLRPANAPAPNKAFTPAQKVDVLDMLLRSEFMGGAEGI